MANANYWGSGRSLLYGALVLATAGGVGVGLGATYLQVAADAAAHGVERAHALAELQSAHDAHAGAEPAEYTATIETYVAPDVSLTGHDGVATTSKDVLEGDSPVIVDFIFTTCATICPILNASFAAAQGREELIDAGVQLVSISIDPSYDTPSKMSELAADYGASPMWRLYTGRPEDVLQILRAFEAYRGDKFTHQPLTFIRAAPGDDWLRLDGFLDEDALVREFQLYAAR